MKRTAALNIDSPIGTLGLCARDGYLVRVVFGGIRETGGTEPVLEAAAAQLREYFGGRRRVFDIPIMPEGTDFQKKVWKALCGIPYGGVCSYSEIAERTGSPKAARAVGMANHVNPIPIIIPCHRVVGKNGKLTGYAGGLDIKRMLLDLERNGAI